MGVDRAKLSLALLRLPDTAEELKTVAQTPPYRSSAAPPDVVP
jgi:hypothetical protein